MSCDNTLLAEGCLMPLDQVKAVGRMSSSVWKTGPLMRLLQDQANSCLCLTIVTMSLFLGSQNNSRKRIWWHPFWRLSLRSQARWFLHLVPPSPFLPTHTLSSCNLILLVHSWFSFPPFLRLSFPAFPLTPTRCCLHINTPIKVIPLDSFRSILYTSPFHCSVHMKYTRAHSPHARSMSCARACTMLTCSCRRVRMLTKQVRRKDLIRCLHTRWAQPLLTSWPSIFLHGAVTQHSLCVLLALQHVTEAYL